MIDGKLGALLNRRFAALKFNRALRIPSQGLRK